MYRTRRWPADGGDGTDPSLGLVGGSGSGGSGGGGGGISSADSSGGVVITSSATNGAVSGSWSVRPLRVSSAGGGGGGGGGTSGSGGGRNGARHLNNGKPAPYRSSQALPVIPQRFGLLSCIAVNLVVLSVVAILWWFFGPPRTLGPFPDTATWRPNPAYGFSNELILHALAPLFIRARQLCSPGFEDKTVSDAEGNSIRAGLIPLSHVFDTAHSDGALTREYSPSCSATANTTRDDLYTIVKTVIVVEDLWGGLSGMYAHFYSGVLTHSSALYRAFAPYRAHPRVHTLTGQVVSYIFADKWGHPPVTGEVALNLLKQVMGVHIRWWTSHMYTSGRSRWPTCHASLAYHPMRWFYKCDISDFDVVYAIQNAQTSTDQPVLMCCDGDPHTPFLDAARHVFGKRLVVLDELLSTPAVANAIRDGRIGPITPVDRALICREVMLRTGYFIGSHFSTLSQTIVVQRQYQAYSYFAELDTVSHRWNVGYVYGLVVVLLVLTVVQCIANRCCLMRCTVFQCCLCCCRSAASTTAAVNTNWWWQHRACVTLMRLVACTYCGCCCCAEDGSDPEGDDSSSSGGVGGDDSSIASPDVHFIKVSPLIADHHTSSSSTAAVALASSVGSSSLTPDLAGGVDWCWRSSIRCCRATRIVCRCRSCQHYWDERYWPFPSQPQSHTQLSLSQSSTSIQSPPPLNSPLPLSANDSPLNSTPHTIIVTPAPTPITTAHDTFGASANGDRNASDADPLIVRTSAPVVTAAPLHRTTALSSSSVAGGMISPAQRGGGISRSLTPSPPASTTAPHRSLFGAGSTTASASLSAAAAPLTASTRSILHAIDGSGSGSSPTDYDGEAADSRASDDGANDFSPHGAASPPPVAGRKHTTPSHTRFASGGSSSFISSASMINPRKPQ